jgi:hypothetical protein
MSGDWKNIVSKIVHRFLKSSTKTTTSSTTPKPPLGPYPHEALYGHAGNALTNNKIRITNNIFPRLIQDSK